MELFHGAFCLAPGKAVCSIILAIRLAADQPTIPASIGINRRPYAIYSIVNGPEPGSLVTRSAPTSAEGV